MSRIGAESRSCHAAVPRARPALSPLRRERRVLALVVVSARRSLSPKSRPSGVTDSRPCLGGGVRVPARKVTETGGRLMPGEHLLVIDDSPTLLKVVEIALTKAGYRVDTAPDGNAGLALVREKSTVPDLILLDGMIPSGDSAEICRRLAADAKLGKVPVV